MLFRARLPPKEADKEYLDEAEARVKFRADQLERKTAEDERRAKFLAKKNI